MTAASKTATPPLSSWGGFGLLDCCLVLLLLLRPVTAPQAEAAIAADSDAIPKELAVGEDFLRTLSPGDTHTYALQVDPGTYLIVVEQLGLDYQIHLIHPERRIHDSPTLRDEREAMLIEAVAPTRYVFSLNSDELTDAIGEYRLTIRELSSDEQVRAYRLMTSAVEKMNAEAGPDPTSAYTRYSDALEIWARNGETREQARTLLSMAYLQYWHAGPWSWIDAAQAAARAAELYAAIGLEPLQANAISLRAASKIESAYEAGRASESDSVAAAAALYADALALFKRAATLQESNERWYDRAQTINNMGLTHHNQGMWAEARSYYMEAAREFQRLGETAAEMNPLANLAVIEQDSGRLASAAAAQERLLAIMPSEREQAWRADTLDNYAKANLILGDTETALSSFFEALQLHEELQDLKGQGTSLSGIGSTYRIIGEIDLAESYFKRALPIRLAANDGAGQLSVLRSLADIDLERGHFSAALDKLGQAARLSTSMVVAVDIGIRKAQAWIGIGEYSRADAALSEMRRLAEDLDSLREIGEAAFWTGKLASVRGNDGEAATWFHRAAKAFADIDVRSGQASSLLELAKHLRKRGDYSAAAAHAEQAVATIEGLRNEAATPDLRAVYLGTRVEYYDVLIDVLMKSADQAVSADTRQHLVNRALEISERAKARSTVDLIGEASINLSNSIDPESAARLAELQASFAETQFQRNQLLEAKSGNSADLQSVVAQLLRIRAELDVLEARVRESNPHFATVGSPHILRAPEMQAALEPGELLLQYWLGEVSGYLWLVGPKKIRSVALPPRQAIESVGRELHASFASGRSDRAAVASRQEMITGLSSMVLAPGAVDLADAQRLIVAADGALQYLPLAILTLPDGKPLVEAFDFHSVPSLSTIAAQRDLLKRYREPQRSVALVGDPVFGPEDSRFARVATGEPSGAPAISAASNNLYRLPFSGQEISRIEELVPATQRFTAVGFSARSSIVRGSSLYDYRYIHFATHGMIDAAQPALSSLVFSMLDRNGSSLNGQFRLHDIYNMKLNADLVVLSGCETALGREIRGEGLFGLTQGFFYAGAKSVLASLWRVPDKATSELMARLYANMLNKGQEPAAALRNAQLAIASDRRWRDPFFWSGFVLVGDWS